MFDLLIKHGTLVTMNDDRDLIEDGCLGITGREIAYVGNQNPEAAGKTEIDASGMVVTPGLINAHTHCAMVLLRGFADDMALEEWLSTKIWPAEMGLQEEDVYWGTLLGALEMLRGGTTTFNDMYHYFEAATRAILDAGIRGCPSGVLLGFLPDADTRLDRAIDFCRQWRDNGASRVHAMLGPHALYTCPAPLLRRVRDAAAELGLRVHIHLAETDTEVTDVREQFGTTPVRALRDLGLLDVPVVAAHCVKVDEEEMDLLAAHHVGVVHNPTSNMKLASGIAPVARMGERGVPVALGTDGACSNNNLDMVEEMRTAALLQKVATGDPTAVPAGEVLTMATRNSARALGLEELVGQLTPGRRADVVLWDYNQLHLTPAHHVVSHLVYSASGADAHTVIVDGRIVVREREFLHVEVSEVRARCQSIAERLTAC